MKLSIVIIGDEILLGQVTDTNSGEIARALGPRGWEIAEISIVGDSAAAIRSAVDRALEKSDLVITTGGLGPTKDDITKTVLMNIFGGELRLDSAVLENVERVFARRGLALNESTKMQAWVPSSARIIQNLYGTAPIMWFERDSKVLISMPGVPFETVGMLHHAIIDEVNKRFSPADRYFHRTFLAHGITESALSEHLADFEACLPAGMHLAYLPSPGYIRLRLDCTANSIDATKIEFDEKAAELKSLLNQYLVCDEEVETPEEALLKRLSSLGLAMATAESCTGGNIAHRITSIPGSSESFLGSVVSYANSVKEGLLHVSADDLRQHGAVSEPVARQMANGAANATGADCAVATTGIAGPGGATPDKPVGTVWMAVKTPKGTITRLFHFPGNRQRVIDRASTEAILFLLDSLK